MFTIIIGVNIMLQTWTQSTELPSRPENTKGR